MPQRAWHPCLCFVTWAEDLQQLLLGPVTGRDDEEALGPQDLPQRGHVLGLPLLPVLGIEADGVERALVDTHVEGTEARGRVEEIHYLKWERKAGLMSTVEDRGCC